MQLKGSCLCGEVHYEVEGTPIIFEYDHCKKCQKSTGAAFSAELVMTGKIKWVKGMELVRKWEAKLKSEPPPFIRVFCKKCGGPLPKPMNHTLIIPAGSLDEDPGQHVERHTSSHMKASWYEITDTIPQHTVRGRE